LKVTVIIPAYNECSAIASVLGDIDKNVVHDIIVADNGSTDNTAEIAKACGARVVWVPEPGYGNACLGGLGALKEADIVVFLDGDFADYPGKIFELIKPIVEGRADFVIGSRPLGGVEKGALTLVQRYGNWLATKLIQLFYGHPYTDLGPFRAIRRDSLISLNMRDKKIWLDGGNADKSGPTRSENL